MAVLINQRKFYANYYNKSLIIYMLSEKLTTADIFVKQVYNDVDVLAIETA